MQDFVAQAGDPTGTGQGGDSIHRLLDAAASRYFEREVRPKLSNSKKGTLSMAGSEYGHASQVFGKVVDGFDTLDSINDSFVDCYNRPFTNIRWNDGWNWIWSRRGITSTQLSTLNTLLDPIILTEGRDESVWLLDPNNGFTVNKTRIHLDNASLPDAYISTRWCRFIPKKVNIFVWRALRDRLPTRWNLSNKGVEIESILCPSCSSSPETIHHSLWTCSLATCVWLKVFSWLDLPYPTPSSLEDVFAYVDQLHVHNDRKLMLHAIFGVVLWTLWSFRNHLIFNSHPMARNEIFDKVEIIRLEYERTKLSEEELSEQIRATDARCSATLLEILGDLPHRDIKPEENVLFVCKLNPKTIDESLAKAFSFYGRVKSAKVVFDRKTGESKRFGFVEFETKKACEDAYIKIQRKSMYVDGQKVLVDFSQSTAKSWGRFEQERPRGALAAGAGHSRNLHEEIRHNIFSERQKKQEKRASYDRVRKERLHRSPDRGSKHSYSWKNDRRGSRWGLDSSDNDDESSWE
ncbi:hypothetical protein CTI12_AA113210 [Artemisia annua]|uniref:Peptidyl-prolyl cis-trans isomerase n=1 Tax=Artemisia annua TaxID=35608 RepID=A0A2U1PTQ7_ARTAN|nr:hypothetical protein CTI12_AA113210 [Artemisia annua]